MKALANPRRAAYRFARPDAGLLHAIQPQQDGFQGRCEVARQRPALRRLQLHLFVAQRFCLLSDAVEQNGFAHTTQAKQHLALFRTPQPNPLQG